MDGVREHTDRCVVSGEPYGEGWRVFGGHNE